MAEVQWPTGGAVRASTCPTHPAPCSQACTPTAPCVPRPHRCGLPQTKIHDAGHEGSQRGQTPTTTTTSDQHVRSPMQPNEWHEQTAPLLPCTTYSYTRRHPRTLIIVTVNGSGRALRRGSRGWNPLLPALQGLFAGRLPERNTKPIQMLTCSNRQAPPPVSPALIAAPAAR